MKHEFKDCFNCNYTNRRAMQLPCRWCADYMIPGVRPPCWRRMGWKTKLILRLNWLLDDLRGGR